LQCRYRPLTSLLRSAADAGIFVGLFAVSMSNNTENFESLRQLLALKRHEQPPPGYFNSFSSQVITRIKLGELGEERTTTGGMIWEAAWLQKIWAAFEARPVFAGTFALAVCGFLIAGVIYSEKTDVQPVAFIPAIETTTGPV
ncbi:MAG: hypothetical protein NT154_01050, partial [Verrucomicrobia bacterium]|nr:hypothetical protein [Verrucomicrobiota bacterium]